MKAANAMEGLGSERDGRAEAWAREPKLQTHQYARQEMMIDGRRGETGPKPRHGDAMIEASHEPDARRSEPGHDLSEILRLDPDVAVRHHEDVVAGVRQHIDKIGDFRIAAMHARVGHEFDIVVRKPLAEPTYDRCPRVGRILDAENELDAAAIVLVAERGEVRLKLGLSPAKRL